MIYFWKLGLVSLKKASVHKGSGGWGGGLVSRQAFLLPLTQTCSEFPLSNGNRMVSELSITLQSDNRHGLLDLKQSIHQIKLIAVSSFLLLSGTVHPFLLSKSNLKTFLFNQHFHATSWISSYVHLPRFTLEIHRQIFELNRTFVLKHPLFSFYIIHFLFTYTKIRTDTEQAWSGNKYICRWSVKWLESFSLGSSSAFCF